MGNATRQTTRWRVKTMEATFNGTIQAVIAREYRPLRHASKILAQHARSSYRTAEAWLSGRCVPTGENLANLMVECEALAEEINRLIAERRSIRGE